MLIRSGLGFTTQAERVAAMIAEDEAQWQTPAAPAFSTFDAIMDSLRRHATFVYIVAAGLLVLAIARGRR